MGRDYCPIVDKLVEKLSSALSEARKRKPPELNGIFPRCILSEAIRGVVVVIFTAGYFGPRYSRRLAGDYFLRRSNTEQQSFASQA